LDIDGDLSLRVAQSLYSKTRMSTDTDKPPDNQPTRPSSKMTNGQAIESSNFDPNLEAMTLSGPGEGSSDSAGLDVPPVMLTSLT
jgi:hypothetical protein